MQVTTISSFCKKNVFPPAFVGVVMKPLLAVSRVLVICCVSLATAQVTGYPVPVSEGVMDGFLIHKVPAKFPHNLGPSVQGPVILRAIIDKDGNVASLRVITGHPILVPAAIEAVRQWKYRPYLLHAEAVDVVTEIRVGYLRIGKERPEKDGAASRAQTNGAVAAEIQVPADVAQTLLIRKVAPVYPPLARQARIQGTVVLSIVINKDGEVRDTKLVSGHPMLAPAAIEAVKQWRYKPYVSDDKPVEVEAVVRVGFRMADGPEMRTAERAGQDSPPREGVPQLVRVSAGIMQGLLEHKVDPEYPAGAKEKHVEGAVLLNVDIDDEGNVGRVELVSGHPMLAPAAMDAVLEWKYRPFVLNGAAVPVETTVEVKFALAID
jgi:TonB family protein